MKLKKQVLVLLTLILAVLMLGCSVSWDVQFKRDGSGSAVMTISKEAAEVGGFNDIESLRGEMEKRIRAVNVMSPSDRLTLKKIQESQEGYRVIIAFRRISKMSGAGEYFFSTGQEFYKNLNSRVVLRQMSKGVFSTITTAENVLMVSKNKDNHIVPIDAKTKEQLDVENFLVNANYVNTNKNSIFVFTHYFDDLITKATLKFPGEVLAYSSKNVTQIDRNTVEVVPFSMSVATSTIDGSSITQEIKEMNACVGFVLFRPDISGWVIGGVGAIGLGLGILIFIGCKKHWLRQILRSPSFRFIRREYSYYFMMIPAIALMLIFCYGPMVGILVAFKDYNISDGIFGSEWVGFKHFIDMFNPEYKIGLSIRNTLVISMLKFLVGYPGSIILALLFSLLVSRTLKKVVQTASYLPFFISWIMISGMVYNFLTSNNGIINNLLISLNLPTVNFYNNPNGWWTILTVTSVWKGVGWGTIVFLAAISGINSELYEASSIDGASKLRQVFCVTLPGMMPAIGFTFILNMGNLIKDDADQILALVGSGNYALNVKTSVFGTAILSALQSGPSKFSPATAQGLLQSVISLIFVVASNAIVKKCDYPGIW